MTQETRKHETWQFWFWLAVSGTLGAFIALNWLPTKLCWIGVLTGGLLGYLFYDIREVAIQFKRALREFCTRDNLGRIMAWAGRGLVQAPVLIAYCLLEVAIWLGRALIWWSIVAVATLAWVRAAWFWGQTTSDDFWLTNFSFLFAVAGVIAVFVVNLEYVNIEGGLKFSRKWLIGNFLAIGAGLASLYVLPYVLMVGICVIGAAFSFGLLAVIKDVFIAIHSQARLVYGLSACVGSAIGYCFGYSILGGLGALACGWLEYRLVRPKLLAKRLIPVAAE